MKKIQVGFLMSYDYEMLKESIPPVYSAADSIFIALDKNLQTWFGEEIEVKPDFFDWIREIDIDQKITIYRDNFYLPHLTAMENELREREMLARKMGIGNWLIQVDCDEYFLDFEKFVEDLRKHDEFLDYPEDHPVQIAAFLLILYKYVDNGILCVDKVLRQMMAINYPNYKVGRNTRERIIYTQNLLLHESVSRSEEEIIRKFRNWGHREQVDVQQFLEKWRTVDSENYSEYEDFFYLEPGKWKQLKFVEGNSLKEIEANLDQATLMPSRSYIFRKNFGQWVKHFF